MVTEIYPANTSPSLTDSRMLCGCEVSNVGRAAYVAKAGWLQAMCVWFAGSPPWQRLANRLHWQWRTMDTCLRSGDKY